MSTDPNATPPPVIDAATAAAREMGYSSVDEWKRATISSRNEGRRLSETLAEREARLADIESRVMPSQYANARRDPSATLSELGIPTDALDEFINERVNQRLKPLVGTNAALSRVKAANPDFAKFENEWNAWLSAHPEINSRLQNALVNDTDNADLAINGTFAMFAQDQRLAAGARPAEPATLPGGTSLPATQANAAGRANELATGPTPEEIAKLLVAARRGSRDAQIKLVRMRVGDQPHPELPPSTR